MLCTPDVQWSTGVLLERGNRPVVHETTVLVAYHYHPPENTPPLKNLPTCSSHLVRPLPTSLKFTVLIIMGVDA